MSTQTELLELKPSQIAHHPDNPRADVDGTDLVDSIKEHGVVEPVIVAPIDRDTWPSAPKAATHVLLAGHRRHHGSKLAKAKSIPALVRADLAGDRAGQVEVMTVEQTHREDWSPIEEGNAYQLLLDITGLTQAKVAETVGMPAKRVRDRLKLRKLPAGIQARVHEGQVHLTEALEAAAFASDPDVMAQLDEAAGTNNFALVLERAKADRKADQDFASALKQIRDAGVHELANAPESNDPETQRLEYSLGYQPGVGYYPSYGSATLKWDWVKKNHGDCPGNTFWVNPDSARREVAFFCTHPDLHRARATADVGTQDVDLPETPEETAERQAREERAAAHTKELEEARAQVAAAAAVRREHIGTVLHAESGNEDIAKALLVDWMLDPGNEQALPVGIHRWGNDEDEWEVLAKVLRLAVQTPKADRAALVRRKLEKLTLPAVAILAGTSFFLTNDHGLITPYQDVPLNELDDVEYEIQWVHKLTDHLGYEWSDFERDKLGLDDQGHVPPANSEDDDEDEAASF